MKKILVVLLTCSSVAFAGGYNNHHNGNHGYNNHHGNYHNNGHRINNWVGPAVVLGAIGLGIAASQQPVYVQPAPVYITPSQAQLPPAPYGFKYEVIYDPGCACYRQVLVSW